MNADLDKASEENERQHILIERADGLLIGFTQIAGLVARRIVPFVKPGDMLAVGQRVGLIRFGSRVDVYLPHGTDPKVINGPEGGRGRNRAGRAWQAAIDRGRQPVSLPEDSLHEGPEDLSEAGLLGPKAFEGELPVGRSGRGLTLRAVLPNAITAAALCSGLTGIRFAINGDWERAVMAVVLAGVLDGIDGRIARLLKAQSRFGAELDSLADSLSFGMAPALILFLWSLQDLPRFGWFASLGIRDLHGLAAGAVQRADRSGRSAA